MIPQYNTKPQSPLLNYAIIAFLFLSACTHRQYHLSGDNHGEPVLKASLFRFDKQMTVGDAEMLDTTALYLQVFHHKDANEAERANPAILKFHNDGYYQVSSRRFYGRFDAVRTKQSVYYGGKFYLEGNYILTETFHPAQGGKTGYYVRSTGKGSIKGDTLKIFVDGSERVYTKTTTKEALN